MQNKWPSCIFFQIYTQWKGLQFSILVMLTPGFEPKGGQSYQRDSRTAWGYTCLHYKQKTLTNVSNNGKITGLLNQDTRRQH
jgi:hypothetical protein